MKVNKFNTRDAANIPKTLHLRDPFSQETIRDENGDTLDIRVYGAKSDVSRNAIKANERHYGKKFLTDEQAGEAGAKYLAAITAGWSENIENDDGPYKDAVQMYLEQDWIAEQVGLFSRDITNYDPTRTSELSCGSGSSPGYTRSRKVKTQRQSEAEAEGSK